jgi:hypothetical protein
LPVPARKANELWSGDRVGADLMPRASSSIGFGGWPASGVTVKISPRRTNRTESS